MKKSLFPMTVSCALIFALAIVSCKRSVTTPAPSLQSQIIGKWTTVAAISDYTLYGVDYKDTTSFTSADYFEFKADSTLSIMSTGVAYNGKWQIDSDRLYITETDYMDIPGGFDLPVLDQHHLQIHNSDTSLVTTIDEKINLIR